METNATYGQRYARIDGVIVSIAPAHREQFLREHPDAEYMGAHEARALAGRGAKRGRSWNYLSESARTEITHIQYRRRHRLE